MANAPWGLILWVFAFVFFVIAAFVQPPEEPRRTRLIAGGLACIAFAGIIGGALEFFGKH
jgi:hypothetical protein